MLGEIGLLKFDHLPQDILENIGTRHKQELMDALKQLPLDKSVPLMMQIVLGCSAKEVADYHHISVQAVYKKNKLIINILNTYKEKP